MNLTKIANILIQLRKDCDAAPKNAKGAINGSRLNSMCSKAKAAIVEAGDDEHSARSMVLQVTEKYMARSCK